MFTNLILLEPFFGTVEASSLRSRREWHASSSRKYDIDTPPVINKPALLSSKIIFYKYELSRSLKLNCILNQTLSEIGQWLTWKIQIQLPYSIVVFLNLLTLLLTDASILTTNWPTGSFYNGSHFWTILVERCYVSGRDGTGSSTTESWHSKQMIENESTMSRFFFMYLPIDKAWRWKWQKK
mgnify:CR=1 FL=1